MWIIAGLGNPGSDYAQHRHNVGFMAIDAIYQEYSNDFKPSWAKKYKSQINTGVIGDEKVILMKPQTYMNLSGEAVQAAASFYKIPPSHIIAIHDELDLEPGQCRVKKGGGAGGHNGLRSIDQHLGKEYWRIRVGIGHPGDKDKVHDYVLNNFRKSDDVWLETLLDKLAQNIGFMFDDKPAELMNKISIAIQKDQTDGV